MPIPRTELTILRYVVTLAAGFYLINQVKKPSRWTGRIFLALMNKSHSSLTDWGLQHVQINPDSTILDVGCGGGRTIQKLAAIATEGKVYGIDYADGSVAASRANNQPFIQAGRVEIQKASVSQLPFAENTFDLVTAIETQYYWPDLFNDMREILRVLKPAGTLLIIAESYRHGTYNALQRPVMKLLKSSNLSVDDQRELFLSGGYTDVQIWEERSRGWICAMGKKSSITS
jgi:ubiquinone/menaquinone biosynthesis C-methylase UbiE